MPGFADYKNMNHLRVKSKKKKTQGELAQVQWVSLHMQGESSPLCSAPPVQTLVSSKHEPQETTGKAYNISSGLEIQLRVSK